MTDTFSPAEAGTSEDAWTEQLDQLPHLPLPCAGDVVVVVAAHPDDESLGAGGLITAAAAAGARLRLIVATDGEASHPRSPTHSPVQLAGIRRAELRRAAAALGPTLEPIFLGLPDSSLTDDHTRLVDRLAPHLVDATVVVSPWTGDRHPDHEACATAVAAVLAGRSGLAHWQYPIWAWHWGTHSDLPWSRMARVRLDETALAAKRAAIAAHVSQHCALSDAPGDEAIVPPHVVAHFERDTEAFVVSGAEPAASAGYFDDLYATADDPWGLADRFYEQRKRSILMASMPRELFGRAFEPGCATGELTALLAQRCAHVVAWDGAASAVAHTRGRFESNDRIRVEQRRIPDEWPPGSFDLVVLSEVGYYCTDLAALVDRLDQALDADAVLVACHWRRPAPDHPHTAEAVHEALDRGLPRMLRIAQHVEADFVLDVWSADGRSVAETEGIVS
ncbi:MAG TPA: PIG-L family deacetylase [Jatrophihabitantaceae bacterium]|nr:PIG-L family deacetylase [Jatrophihabitantaceae bacterium]